MENRQWQKLADKTSRHSQKSHEMFWNIIVYPFNCKGWSILTQRGEKYGYWIIESRWCVRVFSVHDIYMPFYFYIYGIYFSVNGMMILLCPATRKWRGIMLYTPKFWVSVRPSVRLSVCLSVRPSVRPSVSAHHHSCIGNSSYSFRPILLKLYRCFKDGLKICILFFQNPEIIFYHFLRIFNLDIFRALILQICIWSMYLVSATPPTVFGESFWNLTDVLRMVWRYAYCFFRILKLFFITFFAFLT